MLIPLTQSLPQSLALLLRASMKEIEARHVLRSRLPVGGQSAPLASLSGANFVEHVDENLGWRYSLVTLEGLRPGHRAAGRLHFSNHMSHETLVRTQCIAYGLLSPWHTSLSDLTD